MRKILVFGFLNVIFAINTTFAQIGYWQNGTESKDKSVYALRNITLYTSPDEKIENAVLVFSEGKVLASGKVKIPDNAVVIDGKGAYVYPSFIDLYVPEGLSKPTLKTIRTETVYEPAMANEAAYNDAIKPYVKGVELINRDSDAFDAYTQQGFGTVMAFNPDGIVRGTAVLLSTKGNYIFNDNPALMLSLDKGSSKQAYPSSSIGSIALLRQTYYDGKWYGNTTEKKEFNGTLAAFTEVENLPTIIQTDDKWDVLRTDRVGDEFGKQYIFLGSGNEYQRIAEMKATGGQFILPLQFPKSYSNLDELSKDKITISDLKHWELAPYNASFFAKNDIPFAFTLHGLKSKGDFLKVIRELTNKGLTEAQILSALTTQPAKMMNLSQLGHLKKGAEANFLVVSGDIFNEEAQIFENWILGKPYEINKPMPVMGDYELRIADKTYGISFQPQKSEVKKGDKKVSVKTDFKTYKQSFSVKLPDEQDTLVFTLPTNLEGEIKGVAKNEEGKKIAYQLYKKESKKKDTGIKDSGSNKGEVWYPFGAFGGANLPKAKTYLIQNATVWTNTNKGILTNTDVLIRNGKIAKVGKNLSASGAVLINGEGMNLTNGIIDEHSHLALVSVNEFGANNSAEVRMFDALNPDDVNIYRQLAGGVIAAQQLHGSANPVGGQSSVIKFRWGKNADELRFAEAMPSIKFALGENVKQSNWGVSNRFPQSRAGVEQAFDFWFTKALEYDKAKKENPDVRKDLRLETMLEILQGKRNITCHSYVQSEINMLMHLADRFGFNIYTFTHILEGYKVADKMQTRKINGSTFADWWAYKEEVREAIPYNAAIMMQVGVNTAINSDDAEMARRLNQEAGKLVKYGGVSQEEAWKTVTLNPAKMLGVDNVTGTIEEGKSADLVLWNKNPLSVYATAQKTWVDGILYYDLDEEHERQKSIHKEKERLFEKMISKVKKGKEDTEEYTPKKEVLFHCDDLE